MLIEHFDEAGRVVRITQDDFGDPNEPMWNRGDTDHCGACGGQMDIMPSRVLPGNRFVDSAIEWVFVCGHGTVYGDISTEWLIANSQP